jgi:hypothetical protein
LRAAGHGGQIGRRLSLPEPEPARQDPWPELRPLLDRELNGLPEHYRLPLLLCDLEGRTIKEAAALLGCPQGTVAGRLARGRKLLAKRLANRGVQLSAGALAVVVAQATASAGVSAPLLGATVRAAAVTAAGQAAAAGVVPAQVAALTEGVLRAMLLNKIRTATFGLLLVALLLGAAAAACRTQAAERPKGGQSARPSAETPPAAGAPRPPQAGPHREYVIVSRLMEAGADQPRAVLGFPKATVEEGQTVALHLTDVPQNLLEKVAFDEDFKIGTFLDVRVKSLGDDRALLVLSFQRNEVVRGHQSLRGYGTRISIRAARRACHAFFRRKPPSLGAEGVCDERMRPPTPRIGLPERPSSCPVMRQKLVSPDTRQAVLRVGTIAEPPRALLACGGNRAGHRLHDRQGRPVECRDYQPVPRRRHTAGHLPGRGAPRAAPTGGGRRGGSRLTPEEEGELLQLGAETGLFDVLVRARESGEPTGGPEGRACIGYNALRKGKSRWPASRCGTNGLSKSKGERRQSPTPSRRRPTCRS